MKMLTDVLSCSSFICRDFCEFLLWNLCLRSGTNLDVKGHVSAFPLTLDVTFYFKIHEKKFSETKMSRNPPPQRCNIFTTKRVWLKLWKVLEPLCFLSSDVWWCLDLVPFVFFLQTSKAKTPENKSTCFYSLELLVFQAAWLSVLMIFPS